MINLFSIRGEAMKKKGMQKVLVWSMVILMVGSFVATIIGYIISAR